LCLSVALPLALKPYTGVPARRWLEGLLPEGETRTTLEQRFDVARGDSFALLAAIGRDCAGAVSFLPPDAVPAVGELEVVADDQLADIVDALPDHPLGAGPDVPVSLAGIQQKLLLARTDGAWARPRDGAPSTHIFKPDPIAQPGLVAAEALSLAVAGRAGLDVANADLVEIGGRPVLIVERYDRRRRGDVIERIHQEDGTQALGLETTGMAKYERSADGPSYTKLAGVLNDHALDPGADLRRLTAAMTCNVALGNVDGHARNHSFLIVEGAVRLAPLYDLAPAVEFTRLRTAALRVGGQDDIDRISAVHLILEAGSWGTPKAEVEQIVIETLERIFDAIPAAAEGLPIPGERVKRMRGRVRSLLQAWRNRTG
jgi:serine/threonine-protein kinase HipA